MFILYFISVFTLENKNMFSHMSKAVFFQLEVAQAAITDIKEVNEECGTEAPGKDISSLSCWKEF